MKSKFIKKYFLIIFIILAPWFNSNYFDNIKPENNVNFTFYEINPCKISLFEFVFNNQEFSKLKIESDDFSSILCFGRVSQIKENKTILIGTNFFISSILYLIIIVILFSDKKKVRNVYKEPNYKNSFYTSLLFTLLIFSDRKFYVTKFYFLDPFKIRTYIIIFIFLFSISIFLIEIYNNKKKLLINLTPYLFLFSGIVANLNIFLIFIIYLGIETRKLNYKFTKFFNIFLLFNCLWALNARNTYTIPQNIYPGFSGTSYDFYSIFFYSIFFILTIFGISKFIKDNLEFFSYKIFMNNFSLVIFIKIFLNLFEQKSNIIYFFKNFFTQQNINNIIYYEIFNIFKIDERILFLFLFFFIFKIVITKSIDRVDYLPIGIIFYEITNLFNYIDIFKLKFKLTIDFFKIYNPSLLELIIGSGPLNFNQLYYESNYEQIINQHLFLTSVLLFFGLIGILIIFIIFIYFLKLNLFDIKQTLLFFILSINFSFTDSLNYFPVFLIYFLLFKILTSKFFNKLNL